MFPNTSLRTSEYTAAEHVLPVSVYAHPHKGEKGTDGLYLPYKPIAGTKCIFLSKALGN